jgi:hypothetical protein
MARPIKQTLLATSLSAFVWPGAGQLYNRDIKKGWLLIGVSFLAMLSFSLILSARLRDALPVDVTQIDMAAIRAAIQQIMVNPPPTFRTFNILMSALWAYSVVDAAVGAWTRPDDNKEEV